MVAVVNDLTSEPVFKRLAILFTGERGKSVTLLGRCPIVTTTPGAYRHFYASMPPTRNNEEDQWTRTFWNLPEADTFGPPRSSAAPAVIRLLPWFGSPGAAIVSCYVFRTRSRSRRRPAGTL
jgi:hypothetical protein